MTEFSDVAAAALALSATRLDTQVSAAQFVQLIENLVEAVREDCAAIPPQAGAGVLIPGASDDAEEINTHVEPPRAPRAPRPPSGTRTRLSFDDRARLKSRYQQVMEGRMRAPRGWMEEQAGAFGVSVSTIKGAIYGTDGA